MPELPEVETVRRGLEQRFVGRSITRVRVGRDRTVRRTSAAELVARLEGTTAVAADRRGKYLFCPLDSGDVLMVHLRMSGQLLVESMTAPERPHTHVVLDIGRGEQLRFVDPRTFGEVVAYDPVDAARIVPEVARLGRDPIVDGIDEAWLRTVMRSTRRGTKSLLLDQTVIAGIGNIYADEILHRSRIHPERPAATVARDRVAALAANVVAVLRAAIDAGGSTLGDAQYVDLMGESGDFQDSHLVYGRSGERCISCGRGRIASRTVAGRTTCWCPVCQRGLRR